MGTAAELVWWLGKTSLKRYAIIREDGQAKAALNAPSIAKMGLSRQRCTSCGHPPKSASAVWTRLSLDVAIGSCPVRQQRRPQLREIFDTRHAKSVTGNPLSLTGGQSHRPWMCACINPAQVSGCGGKGKRWSQVSGNVRPGRCWSVHTKASDAPRQASPVVQKIEMEGKRKQGGEL